MSFGPNVLVFGLGDNSDSKVPGTSLRKVNTTGRQKCAGDPLPVLTGVSSRGEPGEARLWGGLGTGVTLSWINSEFDRIFI